MVGKIIGIVFASLLLLVLFFLLLPVRLELSAASGGKARFCARLAGVKVFDTGREKKPKKAKAEPKKKKEKPKKKPDLKVLWERAGFVWDAVRSVAADVKWLFGKVKVKRCKLDLVCASSDAASTALDYGTACAVLYPAAGYISGLSASARRSTDVRVACDFEAEKTRFSFDGAVSVLVLWVVVAAAKILFGNLKTVTEVISDGKERDHD